MMVDQRLGLHKSTIDLVLLGILMDNPMNAYELTRLIDEKHLNKLMKISTPAVYKSCKRLFVSGYLNGEIVREGELPEKTIYSVNQKGKDYFITLMEHYSKNMRPFYLDFNSFLWNIEKLEKDKAMELLNNLRTQITELTQWIIQHEKEARTHAPFAARMIIKQYRMVLITLNKWIDETINEYETL